MNQKQQLQELKRIPKQMHRILSPIESSSLDVYLQREWKQEEVKGKSYLFVALTLLINKHIYKQGNNQLISGAMKNIKPTQQSHTGSVANSTTASMTGTQAPRLDAMYNVI